MPSSPVPAELSAGWQHVLEHWSTHTPHDTLLGLAAKHRHFAWLATRYRGVARTSPGDPIAQDRLARVQRAAAALAFAAPARATAETRRYRTSALMLVTAVFATALCLWITNYRARMHQDQTTTTTVVMPSR